MHARATAIALLVCWAPLAVAQARPQPAQQGSTATAGAAEAGTSAGASKSTIAAGVGAGATSVMVPGAGLIYLAFLKSGEVKPNLAEQAFLRDKSAEYTKVWVDSYDRTLTRRQAKSILIGTAVGSVVGYLAIYKPVMDRR